MAVYALSRGQGVPEATRAARIQAREVFEELRAKKRALNVEVKRSGLEGEQRICATFATREEAEQAAARVRSLGKGVELFNVVMEPCAKPGAGQVPQGVKP